MHMLEKKMVYLFRCHSLRSMALPERLGPNKYRNNLMTATGIK